MPRRTDISSVLVIGSGPIEIGQTAPDFTLPRDGGTRVSLKDFKGRNLVLYFYPKADTPGCTKEGTEFGELHEEFQRLGCEVYGISRDTLKSHEGFKAKHGFPFELLADTEEKVCALFGVIKMKNMYGKQVRGIERSTFVLDREGLIRREWRGIKVPGHVQEVLDFVKTL